MTVRNRSFYALFLICGMALGILWGHWALPNIRDLLGEPVEDILFATGGAFLGGLAHELVMSLTRNR
jgi:hypothetical protein